jgi:hypothetical protein
VKEQLVEKCGLIRVKEKCFRQNLCFGFVKKAEESGKHVYKRTVEKEKSVEKRGSV